MAGLTVFTDPPRAAVVLIFLVLSVTAGCARWLKIPSRVDAYLRHLWLFFLVFAVVEVVSFRVGVWVLAVVCLLGLREYFSLVDIRLQDRWGIWGAFLSIPFMMYFIQIDWYGMFIISIPVYAFLVVPFLIALGGKETEGTVFSIGAIDFGLFLLVFCVGHIGYLMSYSTWMAILLLISVAVCDSLAYVCGTGPGTFWSGNITKYAVSIPLTIALAVGLGGWTTIPWDDSVVLGALIPVLVAAGRYTIVCVESDLGIQRDDLVPGRGRVMDSSAASLYAAPIVFHYIRYFLT